MEGFLLFLSHPLDRLATFPLNHRQRQFGPHQLTVLTYHPSLSCFQSGMGVGSLCILRFDGFVLLLVGKFAGNLGGLFKFTYAGSCVRRKHLGASLVSPCLVLMLLYDFRVEGSYSKGIMFFCQVLELVRR